MNYKKKNFTVKTWHTPLQVIEANITSMGTDQIVLHLIGCSENSVISAVFLPRIFSLNLIESN